jgi:uncharacterized protein YbjT (DUF2867 family)
MRWQAWSASSTPPPARRPSAGGHRVLHYIGPEPQEAGRRANVQRIVVVSIIGTDRMQGGYGIAKVAHEQATLSGPISARALRAAQFHEFVEQLLQWGTHGDVSHVPEMRTQLVASRTVAEALAELAVDPDSAPGPTRRGRGPA